MNNSKTSQITPIIVIQPTQLTNKAARIKEQRKHNKQTKLTKRKIKLFSKTNKHK